ncbi:MAG: PEP/pyruvate-binding domain-containing protein [Anaerolineales bacterium]|nr:PEP/pyruvate-binding domain-containing protein [Anaerolineales bacterium]
MAFDSSDFPRVLTIYLELSNYPILSPRIRARMRQELFKKRVISPDAFEEEVRLKALQSQRREGLSDPFNEEAADVWNERVSIVRDHLTDFYFAYNLPHDLFVEIVREALSKRVDPQEVVLSFHPELAPWDMLFAQGESYEVLPDEEKYKVHHHLQEIKVVLIKAMISDHLHYVGIAREWFDISDLKEIRAHRIGRGKIGGKAAGLMLANSILRKAAPPDLLERIEIPRSWFLGANVFYQFTQLNKLVEFSNQKYKSEEEIRADYPDVRQRYLCGVFPDHIIEGLRGIISIVEKSPLIVRSSSLLEDSFGSSFAGKYESCFCPNQDTPENNLEDLIDAIVKVYASVYNADVLTYRRKRGLIDYDERMGILIQEVQGRRYEHLFYPDAAGVAFSRNQYRWNPDIDRNAGFMRLVRGLGTRAVDQLGDDYPRFVALSHPSLLPESSPKHIRRYSQHQIDLINLDSNQMQTLPITSTLDRSTLLLRYLAQRYRDDNLENLLSIPLDLNSDDLVLTFDGLLRHTDFPELMRRVLRILEAAYGSPVDIEFVVELAQDSPGKPWPIIHLLQCRPQSRMYGGSVAIPKNVPENQRIFITRRLVPDGRVSNIRYLVVITDPKDAGANPEEQKELAKLIGRINERLKDEKFLLLAPGRWGSVNPELGIPVSYSDIYNARALIEIIRDETAPEPSYGTHFFQDLVESNIYTLALALKDKDVFVNNSVLYETHNHLLDLMPAEKRWKNRIRIVDLQTEFKALADLVMNGEENTAFAFLNTGDLDVKMVAGETDTADI